MKKLLYLTLIILAGACGNQERNFPDFDYTTVYFPLQYPLRTLILGEDRIDNSLDKELKFHIGAVIGGMYKNEKTWTIDYVVDTTLALNTYNASVQQIKALPEEYYTLTPQNTITIPSGSFNGLIQVQLNDAFLDDPFALNGTYVIPLRMTATNADRILSGIPVVDDPDKRVSTHWDASNQPKDFVMFGIKYINPYHGFYLHRGKDVAYDAGNQVVNEVVYSQKYVEQDQIWKLTTTGRNVVTTNGVAINTGRRYSMSLLFNESGDVVVDSILNSPIRAHGSGKYVVDGGEWGGEKYNAIFLEYYYKQGANNHVVNDTLVFRNNGVIFEENIVIVL